MAVGREASIDSFSFPAVCYEVDPKDLEGSHVPRISSQDPPMCLFLPDSPCLPAAKFIPLNGTCQQTRDPFARKPSETVFENSSRQTRVKKKEKKKEKEKRRKASLLCCQSSDYGMEDFPSAADSPCRVSFSSTG